MKAIRYMVDGKVEAETILKHLGKEYEVVETHSDNADEHYYDTFEWSLFSAGILLCRKKGSFTLSTENGEITTHVGGRAKRSFFADELPQGDIQNVIAPKSGIRALIEVARLRVNRRYYNLENKDQKTVVRLEVEIGSVQENEQQIDTPIFFCLRSLRGYGKAFEKMKRGVEDSGATAVDDKTYLEIVLQTSGSKIMDYSSKFNLQLASDVTVNESVTSICSYLLRAMERNYHGVIDDIDSEFLHDYRIAIRRTRSLLGQMKKLLPLDDIVHFQNEFKWLGSITGPVRDIDVYLLKKQEYRKMVPVQLHHGLDEFFVELSQGRVALLQKMRSELLSDRYIELMQKWQDFLQSLGEEFWPDGERSCLPIAVKLIRKRFKRILKDGAVTSASSPDDDLHKLRIEGKKLRYLLEFYRSFFHQSEIDFFLKQLKKLQNNLGDFNDISVQLDMLVDYSKNQKGRSKRALEIAGAIGGLIGHLSKVHKDIRRKFEATFSSFASKENVNRFNSTLTGKEKI